MLKPYHLVSLMHAWHAFLCLSARASTCIRIHCPWSCFCATCRCYEIRCISGAVLANASSLESYPLHAMGGDVYSWARTAPLVDDYNRTFPGNLYNTSDAVFTQCWNASNQPATQVRKKLHGNRHVILLVYLDLADSGYYQSIHSTLWML